MARLPQPGGDTGLWGTVLNDYLSVAHNSDGSIKGGIVNSVNGQSGAVTVSVATIGAAPTAHSHTISDVTNLQTSLNAVTSAAMHGVVWNQGTGTWPTRPANVPAGMVTYNSTSDPAAPAPTGALAGDLWAKALS